MHEDSPFEWDGYEYKALDTIDSIPQTLINSVFDKQSKDMLVYGDTTHGEESLVVDQFYVITCKNYDYWRETTLKNYEYFKDRLRTSQRKYNELMEYLNASKYDIMSEQQELLSVKKCLIQHIHEVSYGNHIQLPPVIHATADNLINCDDKEWLGYLSEIDICDMGFIHEPCRSSAGTITEISNIETAISFQSFLLLLKRSEDIITNSKDLYTRSEKRNMQASMLLRDMISYKQNVQEEYRAWRDFDGKVIESLSTLRIPHACSKQWNISVSVSHFVYDLFIYTDIYNFIYKTLCERMETLDKVIGNMQSPRPLS